jgi:hypothetical protein
MKARRFQKEGTMAPELDAAQQEIEHESARSGDRLRQENESGREDAEDDREAGEKDRAVEENRRGFAEDRRDYQKEARQLPRYCA